MKRLYRENCFEDENGRVLKDLASIPGKSIHDMVLVDDDPSNVLYNRDNAIGITKFKKDLSADQALLNLYSRLEEMVHWDNV